MKQGTEPGEKEKARGRGCLGRGDMVGTGSSLHCCWAPVGVALHGSPGVS